MKKILYLALLSLFLTSCSQRWCSTRYPPSVDSIYIETVRDSIIVKDTTIYIKLPSETVMDSIYIPCPDPGSGYIPKKVYAETSLAYASAWWSYPVIKLELVQKDTTIEKRLIGAIKESYYWKTLYEKLTIRPEPVKFIPKFVKFLAWTGGIVLLLILTWIGFKVYSKWIMPIKK